MASKIKLSHKKFYDKWVYKVSLRINGISVIRSLGIEGTKELCLESCSDKRAFTIYQRCWDNRNQILPMINFLESIDSNKYFKRLETNILDIYTNDYEFYQLIYEKFSELVFYRAEPKNLGIDADTDADTVIVKRLPHNKYRYKVFLQPHKMKNDRIEKTKFVKWLQSQNPRITCSEAVATWFIQTNWNWDRRYILVEDENTLLMLKLRCAEAVGRIYNYKISDK